MFAVANADAVSNLGAAVSLIRQHSTELLEKNDIKGCWALLDELFPKKFFYRLKLKPLPYSGGKGGKPRAVAVNTVQITLPVTPVKDRKKNRFKAMLGATRATRATRIKRAREEKEYLSKQKKEKEEEDKFVSFH